MRSTAGDQISTCGPLSRYRAIGPPGVLDTPLFPGQ